MCALARQKAVESVSIQSLQAPTYIVVTDDGERKIDARLLQCVRGIFKVVPDPRIPTDGTAVSGSSELEVDELRITIRTKVLITNIPSLIFNDLLQPSRH